MKLIKLLPVVLLSMVLTGSVMAENINDEYLVSEEAVVEMESWMFDENYLTEETVSIEAWMFDESWLETETNDTRLEKWMFDGKYLKQGCHNIK